jgi:ABC-type dipeptide/oligopeptide/nickel transport system permease component
MGVIANNCNPEPVDLMYEYGFWIAVAAVVIIIIVGLIFICASPRAAGALFTPFLPFFCIFIVAIPTWYT